MTQDELKKIIVLHQKWQNGDPDGEYADLRDCDLSGCVMSDAEHVSDDSLREEIEDIAARIRESDVWVIEDCRMLCKAAGLLEVFEAADGESFERVVIDAANQLGVEIIGD